MDLLSILHFLLLCFPLILLFLYKAFKLRISKHLAFIILFIYYLVPITWSVNKNQCPLSNLEKRTPENERIFAKFPSSPFLPLHFDKQLSRIFKVLGIEYNDANMSNVIVGWNVIDFIIMLWFCM